MKVSTKAYNLKCQKNSGLKSPPQNSKPWHLMRWLPVVFCMVMLLGSTISWGQVSYNGTTYTQDFQSMTATNLTAATIANTTMLQVSGQPGGGSVIGWYVYHNTAGTPRWGRSDGTSSTGSFFCLFDGAPTPNRALGSQGSASIIAYYGIVLQNTTGSTITSVNISYDAMINRNPSTTVNPYPMSYRTSATNVITSSSTADGTFNDLAGTWTNGTGFTTPSSGTGAPGTQAAITPLFRIGGAVITQTLTGLSWGNNQYLYIRWRETDDSGSDASAGVDNFSFSTPLTCAVTGSATITNPACFGGTGSAVVTLSGTGAGAPGIYTVDGGSAVAYSTNPFTVTGLSNGPHTIVATVTAGGCVSSNIAANVTVPTQLVASSTAGTIACFGGTTTVTVSATGGTAPYTGTGAQTVSAGPYSFTVTDANGCTSVTTGTVSEPTQFVASSTAGTIACFGGTTTVTVSATGGTAPYTGTGAQTVSAGPYSFTVTDANGCTSVTTGSVSEPTQLVASSTAGTIICGASTANVVVSATGGTVPYTGTGSFATAAGAYSYTVTDANGCTSTTTGTITVTADIINPTITAPANVSACTNSGCTATGVILGTPVTSDNCSVASVTNNAPASFSLGTTTVTWTVTDGSGNTATATQTVTITDNTAPSIHFNTAGLVAGLTGPSSSATPYVLPLKNGVKLTSILSVGNNIGGYQMVGIPDGLGAFDNCDGTFTLLMNHELGNTVGGTRAHGAIGSFVSKWVINKSNLQVQSGSDLMQTVYGWNVGTQSVGTPITFAFNRFCSADLPPVSAFYNPATGLGTIARIFMHGEEGGATGYQLGTVASGPDAGKAYILGKFNLTTNNSGLTGVGAWENALANPFAQDKTIVIGNNDGGTGIMNNSVSVYVGLKQSTGTEVDKAGLNNGTLSFVNVTGNPVEIVNTTTRATNITSGTAFTLSGTTSTTFSRPEDGVWDTQDPTKFYFVTTDQYDQVLDGIGAQIGRSRLWRLNFTNITNPALGGTIDMLLDGTEGHTMFDNLTADNCGHLILQEDVGNQAHNGKIWQYTIATDALVLLAKHDPARFGDRVAGISTAATAPFNQDEETSGIIDVSDILGKGMSLMVDQAHYGLASPLVEGGQLLAMYNPESACGVVAGTATDTVRVCSGAGAVALGTPATSDNCSGTVTLTNNAPGSFPVGTTTVTWTATDASGNTRTSNQIVLVSNLAVTAAAGTIGCNGGTTTLTATATGGSGAPLQYSLNSGPPYQLSNTFTVGAGDFVVTVLDANGCTATTNITIAQPVAVVATATAPPISVVGGTTTVTVSATGGAAPYSGTGTFVRSAGTYNFTVTDANGCTSVASITLTNPLANAYLNILTQNSGQVTQGGIVNIEVTVGNTGPTGAIGAYKVRAQISVPIAIANILPNAQQTGLPSGWTITVNNGGAITICNGTDVIPVGASRTILIKVQGNNIGGPSTVNGNLLFSNGTSCTLPGSLPGDNIADNSSTSSLEVLPCNIAVSALAGTIACNGGTTILTATATGANGPVEYSLNGGTYQSGNTFTVNAAGSPYTVTAREVNNNSCSATATAVTVTQPTLLVASSTATSILCNGGTSTVTVTATGGTAPYTGTGTFTVSAGAYSYIVTDANGCTSTTSGSITQPSAISVSASAGTINCNGGTTTLTVTASGGTGTLQYSLNSGPPFQLSNTFTVGAGDFTVTVKDANGCLAITSLTISQPVAVVATATAPPISVVGGTTTVTVSATGGAAPYSGTGTFVRSAGTHNFTVTDANGCTSNVSITLTNPLANASLNILTQNSGQVIQGGTVDIEVTVGNTGPTGAIGAYKVRAQISVPIAIANILPNAQQTGLPSGWTITVNNGGAITICNGTDVIPVGASRTILIKVQGNNIGGPSTVNGNLLFSNGTSCNIPGSLSGDNIADNSSTSSIEVIPASITANLKLFLQGYYIDGGIMQPVLNNQGVAALATETDSITVELHNATTPFALVDSKVAVLSTTGMASATFTQAAGSYYIAIKHRNTVQTWSANPVTVNGASPLYDFSSSANKAYGANQVEVQTGVWAMYTGDINQDDFIDGNDFPQFSFESESGGFFDGTYTPTDMNGDGFVDSNDFPVFDTNIFNGVTAVYP